MREDYNPRDWYWIVNGDQTRVWSSKTASYVPTVTADAALSRIASERELTIELDRYGLVGPSPSDLSTLDQATLNAALVAPGSVIRALGLVMFAEINKLRVKTGDPVYTMAQFVAALKAQMRS